MHYAFQKELFCSKNVVVGRKSLLLHRISMQESVFGGDGVPRVFYLKFKKTFYPI